MPPPLMPPLTRGLSNAKHLTEGEIFSFLSLRLLPTAKATSLPEGGTTGRRGRRPLQTGRRVVAPYAQIAFLFFNRNGQGRSLRTKLNFHGRAGACPRRGVRCKLTAGASPRPTLILYFVRSKNTPTNPNLSSCAKRRDLQSHKIKICETRFFA